MIRARMCYIKGAFTRIILVFFWPNPEEKRETSVLASSSNERARYAHIAVLIIVAWVLLAIINNF